MHLKSKDILFTIIIDNHNQQSQTPCPTPKNSTELLHVTSLISQTIIEQCNTSDILQCTVDADRM